MLVIIAVKRNIFRDVVDNANFGTKPGKIDLCLNTGFQTEPYLNIQQGWIRTHWKGGVAKGVPKQKGVWLVIICHFSSISYIKMTNLPIKGGAKPLYPSLDPPLSYVLHSYLNFKWWARKWVCCLKMVIFGDFCHLSPDVVLIKGNAVSKVLFFQRLFPLMVI